MEYKDYSAKTLDEAITMASVDLGVTSTELSYEIIEKGSSGILGIGRRDVVIRAIRKEDIETIKEEVVPEVEEPQIETPAVQVEAPVVIETETTPEVTVEEKAQEPVKEIVPADKEKVLSTAKAFLKDVFSDMNLEVVIDMDFSDKDNSLSIDLKGEHMGIIIGKRGQTLDALQYLVNLVVNKNSETYIRIKLDTEDYRRRRKETLENLAKNIAYKVKRSGKPVTLEAMNPYERRTIHYALQRDKYVTTYSEGQEPYRHVVVTVKK